MDKEVKVKVVADVDDDEVEALEKTINAITDENGMLISIDVEDEEVDAAKEKEEDLEGSAEFEIEVDETAIQTAMSNISDGVSKVKNSISDLKDAIQEVEQAAMQSEQSKAFLEMNLGADEAKQTWQDISDIVASMPGDDNTMRSVLATAQALGNNLSPQEMKDATKTMADYMAGSATMGKMSLESQQDIMKYLLDGNTAELERGSIVSAYVDKLKGANTFQERQVRMQEVLNELGYGGISQQDTMLNKQAEWEGMIYNSQDALGSMWLDAEKGAMDYILQLNDASNGIVGMGIVAGSTVAGPLTDVMVGIGQIGTGLRSLKDAGDFLGIAGKLGTLKTALIGVSTKAKEAALGLLDVGKNALIAGYNALKSAAMWVVQKAQLVATTIAEYATAAAQWALNIAMSMNPIGLLIIAIVALIAILGYLYFNNEKVRAAVDALGQGIISFGQTIMNVASNAVSNFVKTIGNMATKLRTELSNMLSAVASWAKTLPQKFWDAGVNAVKNFLSALGIASPGTMQRTLVWEISEMERRTPLESRGLLENVSRLGSDIVDEFGEPTLGVGFDDTLNASISGGRNNGESPTINLNVTVGSVDSEDRVTEIVEAIRRELAWNNATAGRTV